MLFIKSPVIEPITISQYITPPAIKLVPGFEILFIKSPVIEPIVPLLNKIPLIYALTSEDCVDT